MLTRAESGYSILNFSEGANDHESDEFLREQGISGRLGSEFEYVENEDTGYEFKNINWPTIGEFDETIGAEKIDEFIKKVVFNKNSFILDSS